MKLKLILYFLIILFNTSLADTDWKEKLLSNKKIDKIEDYKKTKDEIIIKGLFIDKIRIDRVYTNLNRKQSEVIILFEDLEKSVLLKNKDIKSIKLKEKENGMMAEGKASFLGGTWFVKIEGYINLVDGDDLIYGLDKAVMKKGIYIPIPKFILNNMSKRINPIFEIHKLEIPLYLNKVYFDKGKIIMR